MAQNFSNELKFHSKNVLIYYMSKKKKIYLSLHSPIFSLRTAKRQMSCISLTIFHCYTSTTFSAAGLNVFGWILLYQVFTLPCSVTIPYSSLPYDIFYCYFSIYVEERVNLKIWSYHWRSPGKILNRVLTILLFWGLCQQWSVWPVGMKRCGGWCF